VSFHRDGNVRSVLVPGLKNAAAFLTFATLAFAQQTISFSTAGDGSLFGDLYGKGERAVVLAHGGRFDRRSWAEQARSLVAAGFRVLAIDIREDDDGRLDVLGAVHYLRKNGAKSVSVVGASMGGDYAAEAAEAEPASIDRLVLFASGAYTTLIKFKGPKLFILARDDVGDDGPRLPKIRARYEKASEPKELVIVDGSAHAQFLFQTDQGPRVMREILRFLSQR
jgi:pimeloyl-ACP methyl ester carboxylesterase